MAADHLPGEAHPHGPVDDLTRAARPTVPPIPGAQWDELHQRWERWDEDSGTWVAITEAEVTPIPAEDNPLPSELARELRHADDLDAVHEVVPDVLRAPEPTIAPKGAQWNEVTGRWERWDDTAGAWVEAT